MYRARLAIDLYQERHTIIALFTLFPTLCLPKLPTFASENGEARTPGTPHEKDIGRQKKEKYIVLLV